MSITGGYEAVSFYAGLGGGAHTADISVNGGAPLGVELYGGSGIFVGLVDSIPITTLSFADASGGYAEFDIVAPDNLSPVPEPSALALSAFGGLARFLAWRRRKQPWANR